MKALARLWRRLPGTAKAGVILLGVFLLIAIIGPEVTPYNPSVTTPLQAAAPSGAHLFGTTQTGQDVLSQFLIGVRLTLELAFWVGLIATALSVIIGVTAAYVGGLVDELLSLLTNVFLVIPALPLLIVLLGYLNGTSAGQGQLPVIFVLSLLGWPWGARVVRAQTLTIRSRDFIAASRETGERSWRIIVFEIIPNEVSLIAASFVNTVLYAVGASVALAFIGLTDLNQLVARHDAVLGTAGQRPPDRRVVVVRAAGPRRSPSSAPRWCCSTPASTSWQPPAAGARSATKIAGHRVWPTDPTPVLGALNGHGGRPGRPRPFVQPQVADRRARGARRERGEGR